MYVILVRDDNSLFTTLQQRVMQRSKLVDTLWFLVNPMYNGHDLTTCTVLMEYCLPVSKKYCSEILELADERYEGYLKYLVPVDTNLTAEAGELQLQLTFIYSDMDVYGNSIQRVRKTSPAKINIIPISAWSDIIPDEALTSLDQRIIKIDAQIKALNDANEAIYYSKADDLSYNRDTNELQLLSGITPIGTKVTLNNCAAEVDGLPVVDFTTFTGGDFEDPEVDPDLRDVVLF